MGEIEIVCSGRPLPGFSNAQIAVGVKKLFPSASTVQINRFFGGSQFALTKVAEQAKAESIVSALKAVGVDAVILRPFTDVELLPAPAAIPNSIQAERGAAAKSPPSVSQAVKQDVQPTAALATVALWSAGLLLILAGLGSLLEINPGGLFYLLCGGLLIPPIRSRVFQRLGFNPPKILLAAIILGLLVLGSAATDKISNIRQQKLEAQKEAANKARFAKVQAENRAKEAEAQAKNEVKFKTDRGEILANLNKATGDNRWAQAKAIAAPFLFTNDPEILSLYKKAESEQAKVVAAVAAAQRAQEQKAKADADRKKLIESQFSAWDGSHRKLEQYIKDHMNNPKSYDHVETRYVDKGDYLLVITRFRGANAFGGIVVNTVTAKVDLAGNVLSILKW